MTTDRQQAFIEKLAAEREINFILPDARVLNNKEASDLIDHLLKAPRKPAQTAAVLDFAPIAALFQRAGQTLKWPKITLLTTSGLAVTTSVAGAKARFPGSINVLGPKDGADPFQRPFYGRIHTDGRYEERAGCDASIRELLARFAADPETVAAEYGKLTGNCCFCQRKLSDERSTQVGYGPICADNFGLAWGK